MTAAERRVMWQRRIAAWRASGLSVDAFCAQQAVSRESLRRWRRRLATEVAAWPRAKSAGGSALIPIEFGVPARSAVAPGSSAPIEVRLRGERTIVITGEVEEARLARLIGVVERAP